mgnify:CR=1 FL=1
MEWTLRNKLLTVMMVISLIPLGIIGIISYTEVQNLGILAANQTTLVGEQSLQEATEALNKLGEEMIQRIAQDVRTQVDIYLAAHPDKTIADLQKDPAFKEIIVQSVGDTGYTTAMDSATLINRFHKNEKNVGTDYHTMESSNPDFYKILIQGEGNMDSSGYYLWKDADGVMRPKFGYYTCTTRKTADGVILRIGATTYIHEFSAPVQNTGQKIRESINQTTSGIQSQMTNVQAFLLGSFILTVLVVLVIGFYFARSISNPIQTITGYAGQVSRGEMIPIDEINSDIQEIRDLNQAFNKMQQFLSGKAESASEIAKGNLQVQIPVMSEHDILGNAMVTMRKSIADMTADLTNLTTLAASGNLSSRVDPERYQGEFRNIMTQVNHLMRAVIRPIDETIRLSGRYADNVFIDRFDESLHVEGDFVRLKDSLNNVGNQISSTVSRIMTDVKTLNAGALETDANIRSIATGSEEVTQNSRLVDEYAREGEKSVADVLRTVEDFSVAVSDISVKAEQVSGLAADANALSTKGENLARGAENGMAGIKHSAEDLNSMIQTIRNQMKEIGNIVTIITDIADQTNLLALNAAIEAARAGDAGRGFAVVAGEVKDLANQSRLSAENISDMISVLDKQSEDAAQMMEEANLQVNGGIQSVSDTLEVFKEIVVSMDEINRRISDVAASSEEQAASVQEITAIINEVLSGIRQTAVQADKNNRITAEMSAAITQMVHITESVSKIAESLTEEIDQFKVS